MNAARRLFFVLSGVAAALAFGAISQPAFADGAPVKMMNGVLVNASGMTLYTFDKDPANAGKSVCIEQCAKAWPPLIAPNDAKATGAYTVVTRDDGTKQWAYKGKPLYTWVKDTKPGEKTGDGFRNIWRVAQP